MTEMRTLPVDRAVEWIRAWAELDWPISWETAFATRDRLGWVPAADDGRFFTTELSVKNQEDGSISRLDGGVCGVNIPLSSIVTKEEEDGDTAPTTWRAYNAYVDAVRRIYGPGEQRAGYSGGVEIEWRIPNGVVINIGAVPGVVGAVIESPELAAINALDAYYVEKYGENYVDD